MMKSCRNMRSILAFAAILTCGGVASADVVMYVPSSTLDAGAKQTMAINLRNSEEVTAFQLDVKLPDGVTVNSVVNEDEETVPDIRLTARKKSKHQLNCVLQDDGTYRIVVISMGNQAFNDTDGAIVNLGVTASSSMQTGSYPVVLSNIHIVPLVDGNPGERIDQSDHTGYVNVSNSGQSSDIDVRMSLGTDRLTAGNGSQKLSVALANNINVTAFQFDIRLPEGITVNDYVDEDDETVPDIRLTERKRSNHSISCNLRKDGTYTVVVMSMKNQAISGDNGDIVVFDVNVPNIMSGEYQVWLGNIHVVPLVNGSPGIRIDLPDVTQTVTVDNQGGDNPSESNSFSIAPLTLTPGGEGILNIDLTNEKEICSFQFNLKLPSGVSVVKEYNDDDEYVESISLTERKKSSHELNFKQTDDGGYFLIAYSLKNASFKGNSGSIVAIKVKADESMADDDYGVVMSNILLVTPEEEKLNLAGFSGTLKISEDGAVDGVVCGNANVYSEGGMCVVENTFAGDRVEVYGLDGTKIGESVSSGERVAVSAGSAKVAIVRISDGKRCETYKLTIKH